MQRQSFPIVHDTLSQSATLITVIKKKLVTCFCFQKSLDAIPFLTSSRPDLYIGKSVM